MSSTTTLIRALSSVLLFINLFPLLASTAACPKPGNPPPYPSYSSTNPYPPELDVFKLVPFLGPVPAILKRHPPVQFNGSFPGAQDTDEHVGWFVGEKPATQNEPVDLVSFIQNNKSKGIAFWADNTALELYLAPVSGSDGTFAVRNGWTEKALVGEWTVEKFFSGRKLEKWVFGWKGDYTNFFVCGSKQSGFYGLYYGKHLKGCSKKFLLEAKYF